MLLIQHVSALLNPAAILHAEPLTVSLYWDLATMQQHSAGTQPQLAETTCSSLIAALWVKPALLLPVVSLQAITREWDERATQEERRGARSYARKIARVGIYDRNKGLKSVRRKLIRNAAVAEDEEAAKLAANAARQIQEAAAKSIQPTKEALYQQAAGVKRSFARAEALPEGGWEVWCEELCEVW
jgi:hypothetical protein